MSGRFVSVLVMIVSVPLTMQYLGPERYGMWMTITTNIAFLSFLDFGLSNGLMNAVSRSDGRDDREAAATAASTAFAILLGIAALTLATLAVLYRHLPWAGIYNVNTPQAQAEAGTATAVLIVCFAFNLPLSVASRLQMAYQTGYLANLWSMAGSVFGLVAVLAAIRLQLGLPWLVAATAGAPLLASATNALVFYRNRRWLAPRWSRVSAQTGRTLMAVGAAFALLQVCASSNIASSNLIGAQMLGPEKVTEYSVTFRMFGIVTLLVTFVTAPLWPAYSEALARGDLRWVRSTVRRTTIFAAGAAAIPALLLVVLSDFVLRKWVGGAVSPPLSLTVGLAIWTVVSSVANSIAMFLNGVGALRQQLAAAVVASAANIFLTIFLAHRIGVAGLIWGIVVSLTVFAVVPLLIYIPKHLSKLAAAGQAT